MYDNNLLDPYIDCEGGSTGLMIRWLHPVGAQRHVLRHRGAGGVAMRVQELMPLGRAYDIMHHTISYYTYHIIHHTHHTESLCHLAVHMMPYNALRLLTYRVAGGVAGGVGDQGVRQLRRPIGLSQGKTWGR